MKARIAPWMVGMLVAASLPAAAVSAEEPKALPTLLIKGEVVSIDSNDPTAPLLKVKDRYGFETPIYLGQQTKILQGDAPADTSKLTGGTPVEVEYNFDVNTAKRHAVSVKVGSATPAPSSSSTAAPAAAPMTPSAPATMSSTPAPSSQPSSSSAPAAPSATSTTPAASSTTQSTPATTQ